MHRDTTATGANNINYVGSNYINYLRPAYVVMKGSTRWKLIPNQPAAIPTELDCDLVVTRSRDITYTPPEDVLMSTGIYDLPYSGLLANSNTIKGAALTVTHVNSTLEFEVPFYTNQRFIISFGADETVSTVSTEGFIIQGDSAAFSDRCNLYVSTGEDFTFGHFVGFPVMRSFNTIDIPGPEIP